MPTSKYEAHQHKDPNFPIIFHLDMRRKHYPDFMPHWHENVELLYFIEGEGIVLLDGVPSLARAGDLVVINSNHLHYIHTETPLCRYYCLIIDKSLCELFDIAVGEILFSQIVQDRTACGFFDSIVEEMLGKRERYKSQVKALSVSLMIHLSRYYATKRTMVSGTAKRIDMVKQAIGYLQANFTREIKVDALCAYVGFSKFYFSREFKATTGRTVVEYVNFLRCQQARRLLAGGQYNATQTAVMCGFHNLSYFSKIYKKQNGILPSEEESNTKLQLKT